jgi:hypothetical protein
LPPARGFRQRDAGGHAEHRAGAMAEPEPKSELSGRRQCACETLGPRNIGIISVIFFVLAAGFTGPWTGIFS